MFSLCLCLCVTIDQVLGFPKTEIERKPQENSQTNYIKLMVSYKGYSTEESKVF